MNKNKELKNKKFKKEEIKIDEMDNIKNWLFLRKFERNKSKIN